MTELIEVKVSELLPCPFCGGQAHLSAVARDWYRITAEHSETCLLEDQQFDCPQSDDQLPLLVRDWNARAPEDEVVSPEIMAMLDRMKAEEEARFLRAESFLRESGRASISALQRNFKIGYESACRLMDQMVSRGVVSPIDSEGRRSILPVVSVPKELV